MKTHRNPDDASLAELRALLPPGSTVTCVLRHVARSGMTRHIDFYLVRDSEARWLSGRISHALGMRQTRDGALIVNGTGMDMGFHVVYELSCILYAGGYHCTGDKGCPSNSHANHPAAPYDVTTVHGDAYALRSKWL